MNDTTITWYVMEHECLERQNALWADALAALKAKAARWRIEDREEFDFHDLAKAADLPCSLNQFNTIMGITVGRTEWIDWLTPEIARGVRPYTEWLDLYASYCKTRDYADERQAADDMSRGQG